MIIENLEYQIRQCEDRYKIHKQERQEKEEELNKDKEKIDWRKIDSSERIRIRLERLGLGNVVSKSMENFSITDGIPDLNLHERIIGKANELMGITFLLKGAKISRSIGRVVIIDQFDFLEGYGTGFMVSPSLLLTNNHVLENFATASRSRIQFNYYETAPGTATTPIEFDFEPHVFFETNKDLDFTLVAVKPINDDGVAVKDLGWNPLIKESGKAVVGERVNIIQHPSGQPMQLSLRQNQIIDVLDDFLHYKADTQRGSSGSPVLNDQWEVAALHHAGVPERNSEGKIMLTNGIPWDGNENTIPRISWIANEGVRISKIVEFIEAQSLSHEKRLLFDQSFIAPSVKENIESINLPSNSISLSSPTKFLDSPALHSITSSLTRPGFPRNSFTSPEEELIKKFGYRKIFIGDGEDSPVRGFTPSYALSHSAQPLTEAQQLDESEFIFEDIIGSDDRRPITDISDSPWRMICSLEIQTNRGNGVGTGCVIGKSTILTAAHNLIDKEGGGLRKASQITVFPGRSGDRTFGNIIKTVSVNVDNNSGVYIPSRWLSSQDAAFDYALIFLNQNIGDFTGGFGLRVLGDNELRGKRVSLAGYPDSRRGKRLLFAQNVIQQREGTNRIRHLIDTEQGQSGSPLWFQNSSNGGRLVVGIHTQGRGNHNIAIQITRSVFNDIDPKII